jgi:hypothetical protein
MDYEDSLRCRVGDHLVPKTEPHMLCQNDRLVCQRVF